MCYQQKLMGWC